MFLDPVVQNSSREIGWSDEEVYSTTFAKKNIKKYFQKFWKFSWFFMIFMIFPDLGRWVKLKSTNLMKSGPIWVKIWWSWDPKKRNILARRAEFFAGDWLKWRRFISHYFLPKYIFKNIFKNFEKFREIFSFSYFDFFSILVFEIFFHFHMIWYENEKIFRNSKSKKSENFRNLKNENISRIFTKFLKTFFDKNFGKICAWWCFITLSNLPRWIPHDGDDISICPK